MKTCQTIFVVFALIMSCCATTYAQSNLKPKALTPVTIAEYGEFPLYASLYVAFIKGYFRDEGLDVTIVPAGGDEKVFAALLAGSAQFGVGDPLFTAISGEKGQPGKIICAILENMPAWGIAKRPEIQPFKNLSELGTYSLGTLPGPSTSYIVGKRLFQMAKLPPNMKPVVYGSNQAALEAGVIDIALEYEPNVSAALESGSHTVFSVADYLPHFTVTGLSVLPEYLEAHPEVAQSMVNAFQRAFNDMNTDIAAVSAVVSTRFPEIPAHVLKRALLESQKAHTFPETCQTSRKGWELAAKLRREVGDMTTDAPYEQYVVGTFADKARALK